MKQRVFGVTGWKNSGKTTLVERLVAEFCLRGRTVSTVKHAHHDFDIDKPGADSFRHRAAGAGEVAIVSARRWALMHELRDEQEPSLQDILGRLQPCDLVIVEGYKREAHPKIEARRMGARDTSPIWPQDTAVAAIAADHLVAEGGLPFFTLEDVPGIADFIERQLDLPPVAPET